ncbi:hypothetical protein BS47DRAFT_1461767 [Hydnum rufescens UP504]|uniref:ERCC4 domain-containing protein n=1 Tax=Hydnum rufescens UP504 TaxID=1448309 RepID=A0A9P6DVQ2_9AGAM|nr:hypothetical protein BS47DRAFT_1461767 [Hydnum rufescens UP504]
MAPVPLLPFQSNIIQAINDPASSDLLILGRGLGLRKIVCSLLQIYSGPENLVLLVGAKSPDEDTGIASQLSTMGVRNPGLRVVGHEMPPKERQDLYRKGGLVSVTSRILIVDMLGDTLPPSLITGLLVLHAEKVTPSSPETFIVRLYREGNTDGFLKAFSDQPEYFTAGMFPLQTIMKELRLRNVHIYPRFHTFVLEDLERRKADIIELHQGLNSSMRDIHDAIVQCMNGTLSELKRSNTMLDLDDLTVENAYFRSFDALVRRQLDPVWHKVGVKTKQLVGRFGDSTAIVNVSIITLSYSWIRPFTHVLLCSYLLSYDPITFLSFLETIQASSVVTAPGSSKNIKPQMTSPWLMTDAANAMFAAARRRVYIQNKSVEAPVVPDEERQLDDAWDPILEELPKWRLLAEVLDEIEQIMIIAPGSNVTLIMAADHQTCGLIREFLSTRHMNPSAPGRPLLEMRLRTYLYWKQGLMNADASGSSKNRDPPPTRDSQLSEGLKKKDARREAAQNNRRRVRGGAPAPSVRKNGIQEGGEAPALDLDPDGLAEFYATQPDLRLVDFTTDLGFPLPPDSYPSSVKTEPMASQQVPSSFPLTTQESEGLSALYDQAMFESHYGILPAEQIVIVRPYGDDGDDELLAELRPRWIIFYDPNQDFIRRVEVYRGSNTGLALRLYLLLHRETSEEHKYLAGVRREKDAFERLIKEHASMHIVLDVQLSSASASTTDRLLNVISSRNAGGQKSIISQPPQILVDLREFRSSLPNLLHKANNKIIPLTLTVGDYILTPDLCVERKSLPDLVQSFGSGRLYAQCELMSVHYKQPVLLIEFEENKSFSMQTITDTQTTSKKYSDPKGKKQQPESTTSKIEHQSIQSRLVLLTLAFPRLHPAKAVTIGTDDGDVVEGGENTAAEDLLRGLPGVGTKNYRYVMGKVGSVRELCELDLAGVQELLGVEPGKKCFEFLHHGLKNR